MKRSSISTSRLVLAALLLLCSRWVAPAAAQGPVKPAPKADAKLEADGEELYRRGVAQYKAERYAEAVVSFEAAYRLTQAPRLLYNLGTAHRKLGHLQDAIDFFDEYLKREPTIEPERRTAVEGYLVELREQQRQKQAAAAALTALPPPPPPPAPPEKKPVYRTWWFWTAIGGAAVLTGLGIGLAVGLRPRQTVLTNYYDPMF
ncbi:MAG: tetratricopeptide repeat protein [Myxococcales bacterium]|nr:tetratricopeptide repeat protein [Myxococcales bacterium]